MRLNWENPGLSLGVCLAGFFIRERTPLPVVAYAMYLYLSGLSLRKVSRATWSSPRGAMRPLRKKIPEIRWVEAV